MWMMCWSESSSCWSTRYFSKYPRCGRGCYRNDDNLTCRSTHAQTSEVTLQTQIEMFEVSLPAWPTAVRECLRASAFLSAAGKDRGRKSSKVSIGP
jgi:hypothetical protein